MYVYRDSDVKYEVKFNVHAQTVQWWFIVIWIVINSMSVISITEQTEFRGT